jgi:hypothetical protein
MRRVACDPGRRHPAPRNTLSIHSRKSSLSAEFAPTQEEDSLFARTHYVSFPPENSHLPWSIPLSFGQLLRASSRAAATRGKPSLAPMPRRNTADVQAPHCQQLVLTITFCHPRTPRTPESHLPSSAPLALSSRHAGSIAAGPPIAHCLCFPVHLPQLQCRKLLHILRVSHPTPAFEPRYVTSPVAPSLPPTPHHLPNLAVPLAPHPSDPLSVCSRLRAQQAFSR